MSKTGFNGFPKEMPKFFAELEKNNSKKWFDSHRDDYDLYVLEPSREFVVEMGKKHKYYVR